MMRNEVLDWLNHQEIKKHGENKIKNGKIPLRTCRLVDDGTETDHVLFT